MAPGAKLGVWGGWLSKKPFQKELAMHRLTFDPGQHRVLLLVLYKKVERKKANDGCTVVEHSTHYLKMKGSNSADTVREWLRLGKRILYEKN